MGVKSRLHFGLLWFVFIFLLPRRRVVAEGESSLLSLSSYLLRRNHFLGTGKVVAVPWRACSRLLTCSQLPPLARPAASPRDDTTSLESGLGRARGKPV